MGMNFQSYPPDDKVSLRTPNVWSLRASELGTVGPRVWKSDPPVPAMISRIPKAGSATPAGVCGAKRS